jgi:hypothetical protein
VTIPANDPALEAILAEAKRDNAQDDVRAAQMVDSMADRNAAARVAIQAGDRRAERLAQVIEAGPLISKREAAVYILANLPASASNATVRRVLTERLALLEELAP